MSKRVGQYNIDHVVKIYKYSIPFILLCMVTAISNFFMAKDIQIDNKYAKKKNSS